MLCSVCKYTTFAFFIFIFAFWKRNGAHVAERSVFCSSEMRVKLAMNCLPFATNSSQ